MKYFASLHNEEASVSKFWTYLKSVGAKSMRRR